MAAPTIEQITALAAALGLGGLAAKGLEWWGKRQNAERREPANMTRAAAELQGALSEGSTELLNEFRREFGYLRKRVSELQAEVDKGKGATAEALALAAAAQADHARCQAEVKTLKEQIDALMAAAPAPAYTAITRPVRDGG